jgi:hypothetical protein
MEGKKKITEDTRVVSPAKESPEMIQIKKVLQEQRKSFIDSLKSDLPAYLNYKFSVVATPSQLEQILKALAYFDQAAISESRCHATLQNGLHGYNVFYHDVNEIIGSILKPPVPSEGDRPGAGTDTIDLSARGVL